MGKFREIYEQFKYTTKLKFGCGMFMKEALDEVSCVTMQKMTKDSHLKYVIHHKDYMIVIVPSKMEYSIVEYGD